MELEKAVTDYKQTETALRGSEAKYRFLTERLADTVWTSDMNFNPTYVSPSSTDITGFTPEERFRQNMKDMVTPETYARIMEAFVREMEREREGSADPDRSIAIEMEYYHKNGHTIWLENLIHAIRDSNGAITGLHGVSRDITKRKQAQLEREAALEELRKEKLFSETLVQSSPAFYVAIDTNGKTIMMNEALLQALGYSKDEVAGKDYIANFVPESDREKLSEVFKSIIKSEKPYINDNYILTKDGRRILVEWHSRLIFKENGKLDYFFGIGINVTEKRQAESTLRESEELLRTYLEHAPDGVYINDLEANLLYGNAKSEEITGYRREELIGKNIFEAKILSEQSLNKALQLLQSNMEGKATDPEEMELINKAGNIVPVEITTSLVKRGGQEVVLGFIRDITDRKQAEEALRESEERYRSLAEKSFAGVYVVQKGRFVLVNDHLASFTGYRREELEGRPADSLVHPEDQGEVKTKARNMLTAQNSSPYEFRILTKDGQIRWIIETLASIIYKGSPAILGNAMDITEYKKTEDEREAALASLQAVQELERGILRSVPHALFGIENRSFFFANDATEAVFGWKPEELIGKSTRVIFRIDEEWQRYGHLLYAKLEREPVVVFEWDMPFVRKDGSEFFCRMSVSRVGPELGESMRIVATYEDISDRKRAEEEKLDLERRLARAQKLESLGTLAGGIAHDFNNLLMGIQGNVSLMRMNLDPSHPHHKRLGHIEEHVASSTDLTSQLLGFARGGRYDVKPVSMNEIVKKSSAMFGRTTKEISMHRKYAKDRCVVEADRSQIEQVLMNLFVNAWHAMPGGGDIFIKTEKVVLENTPYESVQPGQYIKITVTDTGTGMDEQTRERIFDPFFTTKAMGRGTGLGLATVYGIIKGHKGMINVHSEPGHGTTFTMYLPASEMDSVEEKKSAGQAPNGAETVLLIDDEPMILDVSCEMLESLGYRVYTAGSGQEAVALYTDKKDEIDLVVLDIIMPGISGSGTFDQLREINPSVKVLLASGYSIDGPAQEIMGRGCNGFVQKPFLLEELSQRMREILE